MLDYAALFVIFFIIVLIAAAIVFIGSIPGKIAIRRGHPWPDAVNAASWIGMATCVLWPFAFVWAFFPFPERSADRSSDADSPDSETARLMERVATLEAKLGQTQPESEASAS